MTSTVAFANLVSAAQALADGSSAEELARKAQDPLADVRAVMTDNTIGFGTTDDESFYGFQIQPVYSIPTRKPFNLISRAVIPIVGAPVGAGLPRLGDEPVEDKGTEWGLSDTILQLFWSPKSESDFKWGISPQVSVKTRTSERVGGPGWGGGVSGVFFGLAGELSYGALLSHHWGEEDFNVSTVQPLIYYNIAALPAPLSPTTTRPPTAGRRTPGTAGRCQSASPWGRPFPSAVRATPWT